MNTRVLFQLRRAGFLNNYPDERTEVQVDWIRLSNKDLCSIRMIGKKSEAIIKGWLEQIEYIKERQYIIPECPICKAFHEHNHGGLTIDNN
jgi:hypothetical protein